MGKLLNVKQEWLFTLQASEIPLIKMKLHFLLPTCASN